MAINEKGFTLIETVTSLVIISIVLLSFASLFLSANKTANTNTEKLVIINIADAQMERLKIEGLPSSQTFPFSKSIQLNNQNYSIEINNLTISSNESFLSNYFNVVVTVSSNESTTKGVVEGYVPYQ